MHPLDWIVLLGTLVLITAYGTWKTRRTRTRDEYLRSGNADPWWAVCLSVMATQASAITFISTPGQGYLSGMGFVQFYFGLPLAMLVIGLVFIPLYYKWNVYTAYEFIGRRFDGRMRLLTAALFLIQRTMGAGITIYAPAIILGKVLHWDLSWTCVFIAGITAIYTVTGGSKAVGMTQRLQMAVIFLGLIAVFAVVVGALGTRMSFGESLAMADALGRMQVIDLNWDPGTRYTLWSGLLGGFFLQLAYFGTDQSQVQRYLAGRDIAQARRGLLWNGLLKIPMQFFILLIGVLVFVFYLFEPTPAHWNERNVAAIHQAAPERTDQLLRRHEIDQQRIRAAADELVLALRSEDRRTIDAATALSRDALRTDSLHRAEVKDLLVRVVPGSEPRDDDHIFITFVMDHLPIGIVGLLLAVMFSAAMSSKSAELSALATTTTVDVLRDRWRDDQHAHVRATRWMTVLFGVLSLGFALLASLFENLIQAVNLIGSLFYGTILGIFLVAFFLKRVRGTAVFVAALVAQAAILVLHFTGVEIAFLWYNLIAPAILVVLALVLQGLLPDRPASDPPA